MVELKLKVKVLSHVHRYSSLQMMGYFFNHLPTNPTSNTQSKVKAHKSNRSNLIINYSKGINIKYN